MSGVSKVSNDNAVVEQPKEFRCPKAVPIFVLAIVLALGAVLSHYLNLGMIAVVSFGGCSFVATIIALAIYLKKPAQEKAVKENVVVKEPSNPHPAPTKKAVNMKWVELNLNRMGKVFGEAIDNGDCFFDAFAQELNYHLGLKLTAKVLRIRIKEFIEEHHRMGSNKVKELCERLREPYDEYRERIGISFVEDYRKAIWGNPLREGKILCEIFQVNLDFYFGANERQDKKQEEGESSIGTGEDNRKGTAVFFKDPNGTTIVPAPKATLEIVNYLSHFVPVFPKHRRS